MTLSLGWILSDFRSWVASLNTSVVLSFLLEDPLSLPPPFPSLVVVLVTSGGTFDQSEVDVAVVIGSVPAITFAAAAAPALPPMVEEPVVDVVEDALWLTWLFWWMSEACSRSCDGLLPHIPNTGPLCPPQSRRNVAICRPFRPYSPCRTGSNDMVCQP